LIDIDTAYHIIDVVLCLITQFGVGFLLNASAVYAMVIVSVCPSVRHILALCRNGWMD